MTVVEVMSSEFQTYAEGGLAAFAFFVLGPCDPLCEGTQAVLLDDERHVACPSSLPPDKHMSETTLDHQATSCLPAGSKCMQKASRDWLNEPQSEQPTN